jgi:hypothetical protein
MAKPIARKPGAHVSESTVISFTKDSETGYYKKTEQKTKIDHLDYKAKKLGKPVECEKLYEMVKGDDWDYSFSTNGPDGKEHTFYFKAID